MRIVSSDGLILRPTSLFDRFAKQAEYALGHPKAFAPIRTHPMCSGDSRLEPGRVRSGLSASDNDPIRVREGVYDIHRHPALEVSSAMTVGADEVGPMCSLAYPSYQDFHVGLSVGGDMRPALVEMTTSHERGIRWRLESSHLAGRRRFPEL
jgi:hypothetical protein